MAYIKQREKQDCGVAALAMLCDVVYEEAERAIPWQRRGIAGGTTTKQLRDGARKLGFDGLGTEQHRLKKITNRRTPWESIPNNSLVKVPHPKGPAYGWHWVAWRKNQIYDPARGVFRVFKSHSPPTSYMEFIRCEK